MCPEQPWPLPHLSEPCSARGARPTVLPSHPGAPEVRPSVRFKRPSNPARFRAPGPTSKSTNSTLGHSAAAYGSLPPAQEGKFQWAHRGWRQGTTASGAVPLTGEAVVRPGGGGVSGGSGRAPRITGSTARAPPKFLPTLPQTGCVPSVSHETQGISRNPLEGRCGRKFLKTGNKKTIYKANEVFPRPDVGSAGPAATWPQSGGQPFISFLPQVSHPRTPDKATFLHLVTPPIWSSLGFGTD